MQDEAMASKLDLLLLRRVLDEVVVVMMAFDGAVGTPRSEAGVFDGNASFGCWTSDLR